MLAKELRTTRERKLFGVLATISGLAWIVLIFGTLGIGLLYLLFIGGFIMMAHALHLAHVAGNGVRVYSNQLPEIHDKVLAATQRLGLARPPEVYVMQSGGVLNAFATKFLSRQFVILNSDLLDACEEAGPDEAGPTELDFIIGHEIAHLAAGHLTWNAFLLPGRVLPWLGPAYSRACEYTCDRCGFAVVDDVRIASRALALLAAGGRYARRVNLNAFVVQREQTGSFWQSVYELNCSHPYLSKRVAALREMVAPGSLRPTERSTMAYVVAPFFGAASGGGSMAFPIMVIVFLGVGAALGAPAVAKFKKQVEAARSAEAEEAPLGAAEMPLPVPGSLAQAPASAPWPNAAREPGPALDSPEDLARFNRELRAARSPQAAEAVLARRAEEQWAKSTGQATGPSGEPGPIAFAEAYNAALASGSAFHGFLDRNHPKYQDLYQAGWRVENAYQQHRLGEWHQPRTYMHVDPKGRIVPMSVSYALNKLPASERERALDEFRAGKWTVSTIERLLKRASDIQNRRPKPRNGRTGYSRY